MKQIFSIALCLLMVVSMSVSCFADVDLSTMSFDELVALKDRIDLAIWNSEEWQEVEVPQGIWQVGEDIPVGKWTIKAKSEAQVEVVIGEELNESGTGVRLKDWKRLMDEGYKRFDPAEDISSWTVDLPSEWYVEISDGIAVFTPYGGKPSLGFKTKKDGTATENTTGTVKTEEPAETPESVTTSEPAPAPTPEPAPEPVSAIPSDNKTYATLQKGSFGQDVFNLQTRLFELGYLTSGIDGDYGNNTVGAVKLFQADIGIDANGVADSNTQSALHSSEAPHAKTYGAMHYDEISRNPKSYVGSLYRFTGKILQVCDETELSDSIYCTYRIATSGSYYNVVYVTYYMPKDSSRFLEDDHVTVYGEFNDLFTYKTVRGDTLTIPSFIATAMS